jgi:hypothetical protein
MKRINLILMISIGFIIYFSGCYSFYSGIYNDNSQVIIIYYPPEPEIPNPPQPCIDCDPVPVPNPPIISNPVVKPDQPVKYRPVQPVNHPSDQNVKEERSSSKNINSRDNSGLRNESTGRKR